MQTRQGWARTVPHQHVCYGCERACNQLCVIGGNVLHPHDLVANVHAL
jgi:hypothetical protein